MCGRRPFLAHLATVLGETLSILAASPVLMKTSSEKLSCVALSTRSSYLFVSVGALYEVGTHRNRDFLEMTRGAFG